MSLVINNGLSLEMAHIIVIIMGERWEGRGGQEKNKTKKKKKKKKKMMKREIERETVER